MDQQKIAEIVGIDPVVLSNLMQYRRVLSAYYLRHFILEGIIMKDEINAGKAETAKEKEFWTIAKVLHKKQTLLRMAYLEEIGGNADNAIEREIATIESLKKS